MNYWIFKSEPDEFGIDDLAGLTPHVAVLTAMRDRDLGVLASELEGLHQVGHVQIAQLSRELGPRQRLYLQALQRERAAQLAIDRLPDRTAENADPVLELLHRQPVLAAGALEAEAPRDDLLHQRSFLRVAPVGRGKGHVG